MTLGILGCEALNGPFPFLVVISDMKYPTRHLSFGGASQPQGNLAEHVLGFNSYLGGVTVLLRRIYSKFLWCNSVSKEKHKVVGAIR
jgi:hypothetical protein